MIPIKGLYFQQILSLFYHLVRISVFLALNTSTISFPLIRTVSPGCVVVSKVTGYVITAPKTKSSLLLCEYNLQEQNVFNF